MSGENFAYYTWHIHMPAQYVLGLFCVVDKTRAAQALWYALQQRKKRVV